jgi:hypothetical protein
MKILRLQMCNPLVLGDGTLLVSTLHFALLGQGLNEVQSSGPRKRTIRMKPRPAGAIRSFRCVHQRAVNLSKSYSRYFDVRYPVVDFFLHVLKISLPAVPVSRRFKSCVYIPMKSCCIFADSSSTPKRPSLSPDPAAKPLNE